MPETQRLSHDRLVEDLAARLAPVRPLPSPGLRALAWAGAVLALGLALLAVLDLEGLRGPRPAEASLVLLGAVLTALTAAFAAFATSVPGRTAAWALLPLAPAALWIGASGPGCLRALTGPGIEAPHALPGCLTFLLGVSLPLSLLLVLMLRRACPLRPNLTAALGGLAVAAAAAALLMPFHPQETTATDLAVHGATVLGVIGLNGLAGGRLLDRRRR
ncbi:NrsF family protein [Methylobacterium radiodurans]|uniref:DUF1109 domain-containing protein n=1 Tax=Methylobacterium radiodurans TaxID=2202828 RepID=A0A2U8VMW4_9HYPH|nr:NrsF family protein [Methylobacterium radiodurans]AWN34808.1 DUF1109 domain-containing protein [Methylobacterium radiodurans]